VTKKTAAATYAARLAATTARLANMPHRANILMKHKVFGEEDVRAALSRTR